LQHAQHEPNVAPEIVVGNHADLPELIHGPAHLAQKVFHSPELGTYSKVKELAPVPTDTSQKKVCGMRREFTIGLIVATLVVLAIVGGAVRSILASQNKTIHFLAERIKMNKHVCLESTMPQPTSLHLQWKNES
jgi:hypothetical protein